MNTIKILESLLKKKKISQQAFRTYKGQIKHGDESACILGLKRKHLIDDKGEIIDGEKNELARASRANT